MPTGYTEPIYSNTPITFEQFVLRCARAMGACIMQRDDAMTDPPKRREPFGYHAKAIAKHEAELTRLSAMTDDAFSIEDAARVEAERMAHAKRMAEGRELAARYEKMAEAAKSWTPPTPEHEGLRKFMLEQIAESARFDCGEYPCEVTAQTREQAIRKTKREIAYHTAEHAKELERCASANAWIDALYASLAPKESPNG